MPRMKLQIFARLWTMPNVFAVGVLNDTGRLLHLRHLISIITCINPPLTARNSVKISKYQKYSGHLQKYMHRYYSQIPIYANSDFYTKERNQRTSKGLKEYFFLVESSVVYVVDNSTFWYIHIWGLTLLGDSFVCFHFWHLIHFDT